MVNTVACQLGYNSYVPFKMVFVEGIIQSLKHMSSMSVPISPVALLLGDFNHIFAIQKVGGSGTISSQTLRDFHEKENYWAKKSCQIELKSETKILMALNGILVRKQWMLIWKGVALT